MEKLTTILTIEEFNKRTTGAEMQGKVKFDNCIFDFDIKKSGRFNLVDFRNCTFKGEVIFDSSFLANATFENVKFLKLASFANSNFESKTRFHNVTFENTVRFDNTKFTDLADFWGSSFHKKTIFYKTDFLGVTVFSRTTFKENTLFTYSLIEKVIIFRGATFKKGLDLSLAIIKGSFSVFDIELKNYTSINVNNEDVYEDSVSKSGDIPDKNKRETFRLLKTQLHNQGNKIDSIVFSKLEIKTFREQLSKKLWKEGKVLSSFEDYVSLGLHSLSNSNGTSWFRAAFFTLGIAGIFYYLLILSTKKYVFAFSIPQSCEIDNLFKSYFEFLIPTHKVKFLDSLGSTIYTYLLDFVGRTLIAYGIYQTIQAFRKYRGS